MKTPISIRPFFALALLPFISCSEKPVTEIPPPQILVVQAQTEDVPLEKDFVGSVHGLYDIPIRARVEGYLEGIHFEEGRRVRKGQLLYTIDSQPFEAAVAEKQGNLAEAKIAAVKAENDLNRMEPLAEINAVSQLDLDAAIAEKGAADAAVEAAEAALDMAEIQRSYCTIYSPIDGLIGKTQAKVGEFVGKDPNPVILNTVSDIEKIRVEFFLPENVYLELARSIAQMSEESRREAEEPVELTLILGDGSIFEHPGIVDFIDREVNPNTGSILIQATFPNPDGIIRPGSFGKVRVPYQNVKSGVIIPQRCVGEFQGISYVYVVQDGKVSRRNVSIQGIYRDYFLVGDGLAEGEQIVFEGMQKVSDGMQVVAEITEFQSKFN